MQKKWIAGLAAFLFSALLAAEIFASSSHSIPTEFQGAGKAPVQASSTAYKSYVSSKTSGQHSQNLKGDGYIPQKTIGITQIVAHESLDKVREGAIDALQSRGYTSDNTNIMFENAYGNMATAAQIATKFVSHNADVIIAIATPSAQTAIKAARETHTPVVFATVTDPLKAQLVSNLKHPGQNVTGTRNPPMVDRQIDLLRQVFPTLKSLGLVINYAEDNSVQLLAAITSYCKPLGIAVVARAANTSAEVQTATKSIIGKADVLFLLQDNTVAAALPAVLKVAIDNKMPVFASYSEAVQAGALLGLAYDEYGIGYQTGLMAARIIEGTPAGDIGVEDPKNAIFSINQHTAKQLGTTFKPELVKKAQLLRSPY